MARAKRYSRFLGSSRQEVVSAIGEPQAVRNIEFPVGLPGEGGWSRERHDRYMQHVAAESMEYAEVWIGLSTDGTVVAAVPRALPNLKGLRQEEVLSLFGQPQSIEVQDGGGRQFLPPALTPDELDEVLRLNKPKRISYFGCKVSVDAEGVVTGVK